MKIVAIVLHFGPLDTTQRCIVSLLKTEKLISKIIIVNNSQHLLSKKDFKNNEKIHIINNERNVGFATGVNIGISYGFSYKADYFFIVNNDTIIKKEILSKLIDDLKQNEEIGIIAPTITFKKKNKTLFDLGGYINKITGKTFHDNKKIVTDKNVLFPDYVSGCCVLVSRKIFEKVGLFDERFFLYYEDVDLCLRVKEKGFVVALDPTAVIFHALSQSVGKVSKVSFYHQTYSALEFGHKYFSSWKRILNICFIVLQSGVFLIKAPFAGSAAFEAIANYALRRKKLIQN